MWAGKGIRWEQRPWDPPRGGCSLSLLLRTAHLGAWKQQCHRLLLPAWLSVAMPPEQPPSPKVPKSYLHATALRDDSFVPNPKQLPAAGDARKEQDSPLQAELSPPEGLIWHCHALLSPSEDTVKRTDPARSPRTSLIALCLPRSLSQMFGIAGPLPLQPQ